ncbi:MAG: YbjN domain-containing protein [Deltaproteobacteria bacterium]|nr:MAG: YbjN domain-containing protein [Deltaproteobacteria bacterium]
MQTRPRSVHLGAVALALALAGCGGNRLVRVENDLLNQQLQVALDELGECQQGGGRQDYAPTVTLDVIQAWLERAGYGPVERSDQGVLYSAIEGQNTDFRLTAQLFPAQGVLFLAATDYLRLEDATSSRAMVLLLTQLAALNYDLLLGKFQLNPRSGDISLSVELKLDDGLGFATFDAALDQLVRNADARYPELVRAAGGGRL